MREDKPLGIVLPKEDWPMELPHDVLYENFRRPRWMTPSRQRARDRRPGMSPEHLKNIRKLPCLLCHRSAGRGDAIHAHHLKSGPARRERGVFLKATDRHAVPLCWEHHAEVERYGSRREPEIFEQRAIPCHEVALSLWNARLSLERMLAVVNAFKVAACRELGDRSRHTKKAAS